MIKNSNVTFVVTAREHSTRIPLKPFLTANGTYILDRLLNFVEEIAEGKEIILTSESSKVLDCFSRRRITCLKTSSKVLSGTERLAEVSKLVKNDYYLMIPCDIWLGSSSIIKEFLVKCVNTSSDCATLVKPISSEEQFNDSANVKIIHDEQKFALFFARELTGNYQKYSPYLCQQLGMYFYSYQMLNFFQEYAPSQYEIAEQNESFRFLLNGKKMLCIESDHEIFSLNTFDDMKKLACSKNITIKGIKNER